MVRAVTQGRTVVVTGAGGLLGRAVAARFAREPGWSVRALTRAELDITDPGDVGLAVAGSDLVVNAAGYTRVDDAETDPDRAFAVNGTAVRLLVEACADAGARLCHVSTDYVFDGLQAEPYVESDRPNPQSVYGRSKLAGEGWLRADDLLIRTSWLFGDGGPDVVHTILALAAEPDRPLAFVDDQRGCPTAAADLADAVLGLAHGGYAGTFHVTNAGAVSWYEFAREVLAAAGHDPDRVRPIATAELDPPRPAPRPRNSVLDNLALRLCGLPPLRPHAEVLASAVDKVRAARQP